MSARRSARTECTGHSVPKKVAMDGKGGLIEVAPLVPARIEANPVAAPAKERGVATLMLWRRRRR